jgi:hypothetical protein
VFSLPPNLIPELYLFQSSFLHSSELGSASTSASSTRSIPVHLENELSSELHRSKHHHRHYLQHDFGDRLTIPLSFPSQIALGRSDTFVAANLSSCLMHIDRRWPPTTCTTSDEFNALQTTQSSVSVQNTADKGLEIYTTLKMDVVRTPGEIVKWVVSWSRVNLTYAISRRYDIPLKPGMEQAMLVVDDGELETYRSFTEARRTWSRISSSSRNSTARLVISFDKMSSWWLGHCEGATIRCLSSVFLCARLLVFQVNAYAERDHP